MAAELELINEYTEELNSLWSKASKQMYENKKEDDVEMPKGAEEAQEAEFEEVK